MALNRVPYESSDGWRSSLFHIEPCAGGPGEPIVLAHALGCGPDTYRYGSGTPLASALAALGFRVFLLTHRGDADSSGPPGSPLDFDAILERDVPAALDCVRRTTGFDAVHWVGHGLGGQLGMVAAARGEPIASVVSMAAPVRFQRPASEIQQAATLMRFLPKGWSLPAGTLARLALPAVGHAEFFGAAPGSRVRGAIEYTSGAVTFGLAEQLCDWLCEGSLTSRGGLVDYTRAFVDARCPLLVVFGSHSTLAGREHTTPALHAWGSPDSLALPVPGRSLDLILGADRERDVFDPVGGWLVERRRLAWPEAFQQECG